MADIVIVAAVMAWFTVCAAFVRGCDRIVRGGDDAPPPVAEERA